ncbi:MAG: hypothetical protein IPP15_00070 [Saprospiraceae bacterium]|uniref:Uncharacterized protein n=1 Tax=Candidatus Opimibacter skivensis TaxID=2982028 RepID=A0A9D7XNA7_9BACT|nr:hypothetical protein [Candidatus Opimibacter skivensis]
MDHVLFLDKDNDPITKVFAIVNKGEIYFQEKAIRQYLMDGFGGKNSANKSRFHRIQERGRYYYGETYYASGDGQVAAMAMLFGVLGGLARCASDEGTIFQVPFVFDTKLNKFFVLGSRKNIQLFWIPTTGLALKWEKENWIMNLYDPLLFNSIKMKAKVKAERKIDCE